MKRLCTFPGCSEIVEHPSDNTSPRCPKHPARQINRKRYEHHHDEKTGKDLYQTAQWRRLRKAKRILNPYCEECLKFDRVTLVQVVDHIKELKDGGSFFDLSNLQSLCHRHHNQKTGYERRRRGKKTTYKKLSDY